MRRTNVKVGRDMKGIYSRLIYVRAFLVNFCVQAK